MGTNFLINKVKNRGKFLVISSLPNTSMGANSPKGLVSTKILLTFCIGDIYCESIDTIAHVYI